MIPPDHPYLFLSSLFLEEDAEFHLSRYVYTPDSLFDDREYISIKGRDFTVDWLEGVLENLSAGQELALHSNVTIKGRTLHIPMIDFSIAGVLGEETIDRLRYLLPKKIIRSMAIYQSGRSYHAYSTALIGPKAWIEFMGRLLLVNSEKYPNIVDTRWVGHRLIGGFSSLRWSNNSAHYLDMPRRISIPI